MADRIFKICGISGSLRKGSFNTALLRAAQELAPAGTTIDIAPIHELPLYNEDLRVNGSFPPPAVRLREAIAASDALLFATAEYNFSLSGVLKNAIDWASRPPNQPFDGKVYAVFGASSGLVGTARAQYHLRQIMVGLNAFAINVPQIFVGSAAQKFDAEGRYTEPLGRELIAQMLAALVEFAGRLNAK